MNKKIFITFLIVSLFIITTCSYSFAENDSMNATKNTVMDAGNSVGNVVTGAAGAVVNGAQNLGNGIATMWDDATNANGDTESDATNTMGNGQNTLDNTNVNYTAERTAANNNFLGMSDNTWVWLILGIVGVATIGLVWYYGAQYEHRNYNND